MQGEGFDHRIIPGLTSIILPIYMKDYALFHYTGNCIGSVREHTPEGSYELVVIDNGSPIQPPAMQSYYAHRVIKNEENLGVTKAWNQGIRISVGEYIVLLNNDVQVFEHWLDDMKLALDSGGYDLAMAHPMYSLTEPFARAVESKAIRERVALSGNIYSDFKDFSCVMFKRTLLDEIGLFDEDFFSYASDSEFFQRMDRAGKKWVCCETVATSHLSDATGYSMPETPEIMNKDKATFEAKKRNYTPIPNNSPAEADRPLSLIRVSNGGDALYLYVHSSKKMHHIKDPETLRALGFDFGQEGVWTQIDHCEKGEEITMQNYQNYA